MCNNRQSSKLRQFVIFIVFIVNLCFASATFLAPVVPSRIRYPAVPVYKKCAKVCRATISPLKQASVFMQSRENGRVRTQNGSCNLACLAQTSNVHQQLRFLAGIWTTAISYKSKAALSMWTFLGGNTQRVHFFILSTAPPSGLYCCFEIYLEAKP